MGMLNFLGVENNFSVLAGTRWVSTFCFMDEVSGNACNLDSVTFTGCAYIPTGEYDRQGTEIVTQYDFEMSRSEQDELRHTVMVIVPALPEGRWRYSIFAVSDTGEKHRLMSGYVAAIGELQEDEQQVRYPNRTLEVRLPGELNRRVQLEWQASTLAQQAAQQAINAAHSVKEIENNAQDALTKAEDALSKLDGVDDLVDDAEAAKQGAESAKQGAEAVLESAKELIANAPREFIPTIVDGYWHINGQPTPYKAVGEDGLDGDRVVKHLVDSVDEIPTSGDTCNSGHVYYVSVPSVIKTLEVRPEDSGQWNAWRLPPAMVPHGMLLSGLVIPAVLNGCDVPLYVAVYLREGNVTRSLLTRSVEAKTWSAGQDVSWEFVDAFEVPSGCGLEIYMTESLDGIGETSAVRPSVQPKSYLLNAGEAACRYDGSWYGERTPYLGFTSPHAGQTLVFEWFDGRGWVSLAGSGAQMSRPATATVDGLVKLGTEMTVNLGAPVGTNDNRQMMVPFATTLSSGTIILSTDEVIEDGIPIGQDASGRIVAESHRVQPATLTTLGTVRLGSEWHALNPIPYQQAVAANPNTKQLANNLRLSGALKHMRKSGWESAEGARANTAGMNDQDYYTGLHVSISFGQDEANGLYLREATTTHIGGVTLTTNPLEARPAYVLDTVAQHTAYMLRTEIEEALKAYIKTNSTMFSIEVLTQEQWDKLLRPNEHTLYIVY